jgi:uncharacterized protein DUF3667
MLSLFLAWFFRTACAARLHAYLLCGQKMISKRQTPHEIARDPIHVVFHVDRRAISVVRMLLERPGTVVLDYVEGRRKWYFGPFGFLFIVVAAANALTLFKGSRLLDTSDVA